MDHTAPVGRSRLAESLPALPAATRDKLAESLGAGGSHGAGGPVADAMREAFVYSLQNGLRVGAGVAALGALVAFALIAPKPAPAPAPAPEPAPVPAG